MSPSLCKTATLLAALCVWRNLDSLAFLYSMVTSRTTPSLLEGSATTTLPMDHTEDFRVSSDSFFRKMTISPTCRLGSDFNHLGGWATNRVSRSSPQTFHQAWWMASMVSSILDGFSTVQGPLMARLLFLPRIRRFGVNKSNSPRSR